MSILINLPKSVARKGLTSLSGKLTDRQIYHPNIDTAGNICLNVLREDWKPVLNLNAVIYGLQVVPPKLAG